MNFPCKDIRNSDPEQDFDLDPMIHNIQTRSVSREDVPTHIPKMNFYVKAFQSESITIIQADTQTDRQLVS